MNSTASTTHGSRLGAAREAARALVDALELDGKPILACLMIAQRLARLMRDEHARVWLQHEARGYPQKIDSADLGWCAKYALRFLPEGKIYQASLPSLEADVEATRGAFEAMQTQSPGNAKAIDNFLVARATEKVMATRAEYINTYRAAHVNAVAAFSRTKAAVHQYATDTLIALELGDAAEDIFEAARSDVDLFVRANCPTAGEQLVAASDRLRDGTPEALSHALTSCRRILVTTADVVFPARAEPYVDGNGKSRSVGPEEYKNRLLAFIEQRVSSASTRAILGAQIAETAARVDAINDKACKGVHDDVTIEEARLVVIHTYLLIADIARLANASSSAVAANSVKPKVSRKKPRPAA